MRKILLVLFLAFGLSAGLVAAQKDFIVLLDTSESMFDNYDQLVKLYFPEVVKEHLKSRDVFHLMSFSEKPELELTQKIDTKEDMEVVLKRLLLLQPLGKFSDTVLAFRFLYQYAVSLPTYQPKTIVVFTNGRYKTPAGQGLKKDDAEKELQTIVKQIKTKGWDIRFVRLSKPSSAAANDGSIDIGLDRIATDLSVPTYDFQASPGFSNQSLGSPRITFPKDLGKIGKTFSLNFSVENPRDSAVLLKVKEVLYGGENILSVTDPISLGAKEKKDVGLKVAFVHPPKDGPNSGTFTLTFDDDARAFPSEATIAFDYSAGFEGLFLPIGIALAILLLAALVIGIVVLLRKGYEHGKATVDLHVRSQEKEETAKLALRKEKEDETPIKSKSVAMATAQMTPEFVKTQPEKKISLWETSDTQQKKSAFEAFENKPAKVSADWGTSHPKDPTEKKSEDLLVGKKKPDMSTWGATPKEPLSPSFQKSGGLDKATRASSWPTTEKTGDAKYQDFAASQSAQKKDFDEFLKKSETSAKRIAPTAARKETSFVQVADVNAPSKDFRMQVWTQDFVFQNTSQGANILTLKPGERRTVGNQKAHFKVLIANVQDAVAEVVFDGETLVFDPLVPELFPTLEGPTPCLGSPIQLRIGEQKTLFLQFSRHVSATEETNRLLRGDAPTLEDA